jgi:hypothetical protein
MAGAGGVGKRLQRGVAERFSTVAEHKDKLICRFVDLTFHLHNECA